MNINPICNDGNCSAGQNFRAKMPVSRIKVAEGADEYVQYMVDKFGSIIENNAEVYETMVRLAQRKENGSNALYVNSGTITSRIDLKDIKHASDFYRGIVNNIRANCDARTKGLVKGFERLA